MSQAPGSLDEVPYQFISGEEELECLVTELSQCSEFAIDLEVCSVWCFLVLYTCQHSFHTSYLFSDFIYHHHGNLKLTKILSPPVRNVDTESWTKNEGLPFI